ncbi:MAG: YqaJ viral recombinase family protein [Acidovorax sp.]|nr:YqaJ viral recombinase family protein [Acidovorax sp.]
MTFEILTMAQGSAAWHQHRATALNASDAPAMLACSPYKSRSDLVRERATGLVDAEIDQATARRFADGHRFEALARPLAEQIIGEELSPCVGKRGKYSASFDGLTFMCDVAFEHKTLGNGLRAAMAPGCTGADLPLHYRAQMEQQAMVSGCERILFMASQWDAEDRLIEERHCWYEPDAELRAQIIAGWEQFEKDVAAYAPTEAAAPVVAAPMESLPAVVVQVQGALTVGGNLPAFGQALRAFIERIPAKPETDQQFADAEAACKALKKAEDALAQAEDGALAQISDVELMRRTVADLKNLARSTRLATEKLVAAEKEARREQLVRQTQASMIEHVMELNRLLQADGAGHLPTPPAGLFAPCIKGLKSLDSMRDKLTAELLAHKTQAGLQATRMHANRASLRTPEGDWIFLFADFAQAGTKEAEDFAALAQLRIGQHQQREFARLEAERARIRAEEERRAREKAELEETAERVKAEQAAQAEVEKAGTALLQQAKEQADSLVQTARAIDREADTCETLTLGAINALLSPIRIDAAGLAELGFEPSATVKAAKHYRATDFARICQAISNRAMAAAHGKHRADVE